MPHRFYAPRLVESGSITLVDTEAHHLMHVLRHQPGDLVELFDGEGLVATCQIQSLRKRDVDLDVFSVRREMTPTGELILATAVPKGDRFDWLVEKATELGVSRLVPLVTARSIVEPREGKLDKLRQTVISACKQSGRNHLMKISEVTSLNDFLDQFRSSHQIYVAHIAAQVLDGRDLSGMKFQPRAMAILIGPEGGFSDEEVETATAAGAQAIQLGPNILRIETAAIALAARLLL